MNTLLYCGDSRHVLPTLPADSVDAVITDPPAGIGFMGKEWDDFRRSRNPADTSRENQFGRLSSKGPEYGRRDRDSFVDFLSGALSECLRIARPGSVLLCWAIPRTSHWTGLAIESAGWQIEDRIAHHFGQGFPKHKSKLKPATEDWWLARKPGLKWLGVEACRVGEGDGRGRGGEATAETRYSGRGSSNFAAKPGVRGGSASGRWPANLVLSHSPDCNGECVEGCPVSTLGKQSQLFPCFDHDPFTYTAKASRQDRNEGCEGMPLKNLAGANKWTDCGQTNGHSGKPCNGDGTITPQSNFHPTVKSVHLMRWLCRLACPPGGTILDPFMGSGSTGKAAVTEGMRFIGVEKDPEYHAIAEKRIAFALGRDPLFQNACV